MNILKRLFSGLLLAAILAGPMAMTVMAIPGSPKSTSTKSHKANTKPKTVHVKAYTKKNGETVKAHDRAAPEPKQ
jgi:hypothetical protein